MQIDKLKTMSFEKGVHGASARHDCYIGYIGFLAHLNQIF